ncbi:MAG: hypothetical protein ACK45E_02025, partial [Ignavibacteria bacterium]
MKIIACIMGLLAVLAPLQGRTSDTSAISPIRLGIVGGATIGGFVMGHAVLNDLWWKGTPTDFHFN